MTDSFCRDTEMCMRWTFYYPMRPRERSCKWQWSDTTDVGRSWQWQHVECTVVCLYYIHTTHYIEYIECTFFRMQTDICNFGRSPCILQNDSLNQRNKFTGKIQIQIYYTKQCCTSTTSLILEITAVVDVTSILIRIACFWFDICTSHPKGLPSSLCLTFP